LTEARNFAILKQSVEVAMNVYEHANAPGPIRRTVRHCAYALIYRNGRIAVDIFRANTRKFGDLPGGGLEWITSERQPAILETEEQAVAREVMEEVCLLVRPCVRLAEAVQGYRSSDGRTDVLSYAALWVAEYVGPSENQPEPGHHLKWLDPHAAIDALRHESHR